MKCPDCQHENTVEAEFCVQCAAPLRQSCPACGSRLAFAARFCPQCGHALKPAAVADRFASPRSYTPQHLAEKIITSRAAIEGERKQVTVLFADIKDSMTLFAERDPEAVQDVLDPVLERMIEAVHHYEGTVNRVMGDGIMALFGAPLAHEDHAVRACYAALRMQEAIRLYADGVQRTLGVPLAVRVGLNSGEIVVRAVGNDLHMDYTVVGQTAHLAARMEQMASPGSVLTTADTFQLTEGYVAMAPLGAMAVKGLANPVQVYEVTGMGRARTRLEAAAERGLTPFVGRNNELETLRRAQQLANQGRGQLVAIIGEAGVGKSRLVYEFVHSTDAAGWLILRSHCVSYGHATPYLPVIEMLRQYFRITAQDSTQSIRDKVTAKILALDPSLDDTLPPVLDLLDALGDDPFRSIDPLEHRQRTYQAVTRLLLSETDVQPVMVIFDDLHWSDPLTLGLLLELAVRAQDNRFLLMVGYRPDYKDQWTDQPNYHQLRLNPLPGDGFAELLQALLGSDPSLPVLKDLLTERASRNPFFVEEIVRALVETNVLEGARGGYRLASSISDVDVPPTVQTVLAARIDALPAAEKRLLQEAAVIGQAVPLALLREISGLAEGEVRGLLDKLEAAEFLRTTQLDADPQYTFKHSLTHDVAYGGVLHERRREIHARVVHASEKLFADRLDEQVERLAHHALRGGLQEKAVHYLQLASRKAGARAALSEACTLFEQALGILKKMPETDRALQKAFEIYLELRPVLRQLGEGRKMLEHLREAEALADRLKDDGRRGLVFAFMTTVQSTLDELEEAIATGTRGLEIARRRGDLKLQIVTTSYLEQAYYYRGDYEQVAHYAIDNLAALPADWTHEYLGMAVPPAVFDRAWLVMSLAELGRFDQASKYEAEAIQIAETTEHAFTIGWAHFGASMLHLLKGDWTTAQLLVDRWITMVRTGNVTIHHPWAVATSAWVLAQIGEPTEALDLGREAEQLLEQQAERGIVGHHGWAYHAVARAYLLLGLLDEARRLGNLALQSSQRQPGFAAHALLLMGDVASHPDQYDPETAASYYAKTMELARSHGMRPLQAHCHFAMGKLQRRTGEPEHSNEDLTIAATMYREMDMGFWLERALAELTSPIDVGSDVHSGREVPRR